ncbi:MAG: redoxin family protein [Candidatus Sulfotelmatobacter sp.]
MSPRISAAFEKNMGIGRFVFRGNTFLAGIFFACLGCGALAQTLQTAFDLDGKPANPIAQASGRVVVLVFLRQDCPVSSRYAPIIQQISERYQHDASFFLVYPDKTESAQTIRKYLADYGYHVPALRDPEHALVKQALAEITPEAAVFNREGRLIYHGRIDNWYVEFGRSRPAPTTHELVDAINAAVAGKPPVDSAIKGVGCYISDLE